MKGKRKKMIFARGFLVVKERQLNGNITHLFKVIGDFLISPKPLSDVLSVHASHQSDYINFYDITAIGGKFNRKVFLTFFFHFNAPHQFKSRELLHMFLNNSEHSCGGKMYKEKFN